MVLADSSAVPGYVNPSKLGNDDVFDLLTQDGEHREVSLQKVRCVYFVREFTSNYELERKAFLSRPKLDGLWVRLKFRDLSQNVLIFGALRIRVEVTMLPLDLETLVTLPENGHASVRHARSRA